MLSTANAALIVAVLGGAGCSGEPGDFGEDEPITEQSSPLSEKPVLRMPFAPGESHRCTQGNFSGFSHGGSTTKHGLDFGNSSGDPVVAALAGEIAYVKTGCVKGDKSCSGGWGNHVRINHGGQFYTLYAHLASVSADVAVGKTIGRGQLVGSVGGTGNATGDHLHFSLHQGNASAASVAPSVAYRVWAGDETSGGGYTEIQSTDFLCGLGSGHRYASDNACSSVFNSLGSAKEITSNIPYSGEACHNGDVDYFYFGGASGSFDAKVASTSQSIFDCSCAILDAQGNELPKGGAEGYTRDDGWNGGQGCACSLSNAGPGLHYLKVFAHVPGAYVFYKTLP